MIDTVIFDLDGVIIDSEPVHQAIEKQLFKELGIEVPETFHQKLVGMNEEDLWGKVITEFGLDTGLQSMVDKKRAYLKSSLENPQVFKAIPAVIILIKTLKEQKYTLVLASSSPLFYIETILKYLDIHRDFDAVVSGEEVTHSKPAPDIFLEAARRVGKEPPSCLVIEDSANGIRAAKGAGMTVLGYGDRQGSQDLSDADYTIYRFEDFDLDKLTTKTQRHEDI
jgi:HAD superfamily hydrolase (TIGR01509 family)